MSGTMLRCCSLCVQSNPGIRWIRHRRRKPRDEMCKSAEDPTSRSVVAERRSDERRKEV